MIPLDNSVQEPTWGGLAILAVIIASLLIWSTACAWLLLGPPEWAIMLVGGW